MTNDELQSIINNITKGKYTEADLSQLRQILISQNNSQASLQLGKFNVNIEKGNNIHIGDCIYYSWDDQAISALVKMIRSKSVEETDLLVTKLNNAQLKGEEGDRTTGSFYTYDVWIEDAYIETSHNATENNSHPHQYTICGKWYSKVYKEINLFGFRVDYPWGKAKTPYGQFTIKIGILHGLANQIKVNIARYNDSPNNYAADKTEQLIKSKLSEFF